MSNDQQILCFLETKLGNQSIYLQFKMNPGHQPQRFQVFTELADGTGFTLKECSYIFLYDKYGGWFDQFGNYYNSNADPSDPPTESEDDKSSLSYYSQYSQYEDEYEKEFGPPPGVRGVESDEQSQQQTSILETIAQNQQRILGYPQQQPLRVYFRNLSRKIKRKQFLDHYCSKIEGKILNVIIDTKNGRNEGTGYLIVNPQTARQLIQLQRQRIAKESLIFDVQSYENYLILPITQKQIEEQPKQEGKIYVPKQTVEQKQELPKEQIRWGYYKFEKALFPKKISFKNWMIENGFNEIEDFKNPQKLEGDEGKKYVKINMKQTVYKCCNGLSFQQKKIQFIPL